MLFLRRHMRRVQRGLMARRRGLPDFVAFESDFSPNNAGQVVADVGNSLSNIVGTVGTLAAQAYNNSGGANAAAAVGNIGRGIGLRIWGSIGSTPAPGGSWQVWWAVDDAFLQGYFLSVNGSSNWTLYKRTAGVDDALGTYNTNPPANGDKFVITHSRAGAITVAINGATEISVTGHTDYSANEKWGFDWSNSAVGAIGTHADKSNKFVVEAA